MPEHKDLLNILSGNGNPAFFRTIAVNFVQNFVDGHFANNPDIKPDWTSADTQKAVDLYLTPVADEMDRRVTASFASGIPSADAKRLTATLATDAARATMNCALVKPLAERTPSVWEECERSNGGEFSAEDRTALGNVQSSYAASLAQPAVNGALGGTICHVLARFAQHLSKDGTSYTFGTSFALNGSEEPKRCDVHKPRWAALAGFDALVLLEPQIVFEKRED